MTDLNIAQLLLLVIVLQQTLAAGVWALAVKAKVTPRVPALHWVLGALWAAIVVALSLLPDEALDWYRHGLPNLLSPGIYILLRLGLQILFRAPRHDAEHLMVMLLALGSAALGGWLDAPAAWAILYTSVLNAYCLGRTVQCVFDPAAEEVGRKPALLMLMPLAVLALVFALRAVAALWVPDQVAVPLAAPTLSNVVVLTLFLSFGVLLHLSLGMAIALRLVTRLRQLAVRDPLTGLLNRRGLAEGVKALSGPLSVIVLDVDHFKRVNDGHGHAVGDAALRHLAELLRREARSSDLVARVGGEEFLLLLAGVPLATALQTAERLRALVEQHPLRLAERQLPMTVSLGVAEQAKAEALDALIGRADRALYRAKALGRNRVETEGLA